MEQKVMIKNNLNQKKGIDSDPKGVSFEKFSVTKDLFNNYVDKSEDYIGKSLSVLSDSIDAKNEAVVKNLEELFTKLHLNQNSFQINCLQPNLKNYL